MPSFRRLPWLIGAGLLHLGLALPAVAQPVKDFYTGKTIEILVGAAAGGGYDLAARTLANHMGRHIPGRPNIVVRNMPGATGLIMTNNFYNTAKRDGTAIGMPTSNIPLEPRLKVLSPDGTNIKFDIDRLIWIGTPVQEPQIAWVWHDAPAKSVADLKTNVIAFGATSPSSDNYILPLLANQLIGTKTKVFAGYQGQNEINLAVERGEVQGNNTGLSNITVNKADWVRDTKVRILLQYGEERLPEIKDVPTVLELATSEADRALLRFYASKFSIARPLALPPDVPDDRVKALRAAFDATMKDPQYLEEAKRIGMDVNPLSGEEVERLVRNIQATPQDIIDRTREILSAALAK
jgi:tripartite-type tricarboxylate transporter receptor subunit TctC